MKVKSIIRLVVCLILSFSVLTTTALPVLADGEESSTELTEQTEKTTGQIESGVKGLLQQVYSLMTAVVLPIALVIVAWAGINVLISGEDGMRQAKKRFLYVIVAFALIWFAPVVIVQVSSWFNGMGTAGIFD